ncbi:MAG: DnaJ domain-containing protein [Allosphingosinicella sp.]
MLGVDRAAATADVTRAYRELARRHHPDAGGNRAEWDRLTEAYEQAKRERGL